MSLSNHSLNNSSWCQLGCFKTLLCHPNVVVKFAWLLALFLEKKVKCQVVFCKILRVSLLGWKRHGSLLGHLQRYFVIKPGSAKWITFFFYKTWVVVWNKILFSSLFWEMIQFDAHIFQMGWVQPPTRKLACLNLNLCQASFQVLCLSLNGITLNSHFVGNGAGNPKVAWHMQWKTAWDFSHFPVLMVMAVGASGWCNFSVQHGEAWRSLYWGVVMTCK